MSVYLGYDTITKQYLKDLVSDKKSVMREWTNYYVNVYLQHTTTYVWPHGYVNFPCSVRNVFHVHDKIILGASLVDGPFVLCSLIAFFIYYLDFT